MDRADWWNAEDAQETQKEVDLEKAEGEYLGSLLSLDNPFPPKEIPEEPAWLRECPGEGVSRGR